MFVGPTGSCLTEKSRKYRLVLCPHATTKGHTINDGLISESFSLWLKSPKMGTISLNLILEKCVYKILTIWEKIDVV